jgi:DNA-binding winged helix-turn-helix (wHTH) protein
MKLVNDLGYRLSPQLIKAIYRKAYQLDANVVIINKAKWNWADIAMFEDEDCIDWHIYVQG